MSEQSPVLGTYGNRAITLAEFLAAPASSQAAIIRRGFQHYHGNEQASKVSTAKSKRAAAIAAWDASNESERTGERPTEHTAEELSDMAQGHARDAWAAFDAGQIGQGRGPSAPKVDPVEKVMLEIAKRELVPLLQRNGLKLPTGDKTITLPNGWTGTAAQMIALRANSPKETARIRDLAVKEIKAREKAAASAAKATEGGDLADMLGL